MPNILLVCTANICRSPVVAAVLRDRLQKLESGDEWQISSAGTWARQGNAASENSVLILAEQGLDISNHRSRHVDQQMLADADLILCMETGHTEALRAEFPMYADRIHLLSEMAGLRYSINDPYGGPLNEYQRMVDEVTGLVDDGLPRIIELAQENARSRMDGS